MEVRMKLEVSAESVARGNNSREEMSFFRPGKHRLSRGPKEAVKQESIFIK